MILLNVTILSSSSYWYFAGHSLEEIRVRALQNILSKLEHGLVCDADLVQEKVLHIRLLEWFNFSSCPQEQQVLALILRLTKVVASVYTDVLVLEVAGSNIQ